MRYPYIFKNSPKIMHGGDYNPDQWRADKAIWREDMRLAKLARINTLSVGIFAWAALEPQEGIFDFTWLDEILDLMAENDIAAVLATPSGARPAWMSQKYPEVLRVGADRRRNLHGGRHNHCFTSPIYREKTTRINTLLAERYKGHPALAVWHLSNEYGGECHCDLCQNAFREWLKRRYASLDDLNRAWWTSFWSHTYSDWSQVESPSPIGERSVHGLVLDWKRFVTDQTIDFMKSEMAPLKLITPDVPCTTNMMGFYDGLNYFRLAEELDVASWDNYPQWRADNSDVTQAARIAMTHDLNRCLKDGRPFMLMESSPSATNWQPTGKLKRPGVQRLESLLAVAHGSDTVQYFQYRKSRGSFEKFHGAVVDHEGTERMRVYREVASTGAALERLGAVAGAAKPADVAIIYDVENRWALDTCTGFTKDKKYVQTLAEHYTPFWNAGISVDLIDSGKDLSKYKLVIAPMLYMLKPGVAEKIERFVDGGGTFVATYMTGYVDEHDLCYLGGFPGPLKAVLGIWCEEIDALYEGEYRKVRWNEREYAARELCEMVHIDGAEAIGVEANCAEAIGVYMEDFYAGNPAITVNRRGKGEAYFIAARLDKSFHEDFYGALAQKLDIRGAIHGQLPEGCTAQARTDGVNNYIFLMNFSPEEKVVNIGDGGNSLLSGDKINGDITLAPWGVEVYRTEGDGTILSTF